MIQQKTNAPEWLHPTVHETDDGSIRVVFGEFMTLLFDIENAGKFARWLQDVASDIERKRQQTIPHVMVTSAMVEGNPLRKAKKV